MKQEDRSLSGWEGHRFSLFLKSLYPAKAIMKFFLKLFGLKYLTFNWGYPRPAIEYIKWESKGKELTGAEIGVKEGRNAETMLKLLNIKKLYLIDPYEEYTDENFEEGETEEINGDKTDLQKKFYSKKLHHTDKFMEDIMKNTISKFEKYKDKVIFVRKKSEDAVNNIDDDLDFIYIDGNHTYEYVLKDLNNYYKKIKEGGILCGHDFCYPNMGVVKAILDFVIKNNLKDKFKPFGLQGDWVIEK